MTCTPSNLVLKRWAKNIWILSCYTKEIFPFRLLDKLSVICPNSDSCKENSQRGILEDHLKYRCDGTLVACQFAGAGCIFRGPVKKMKDHQLECTFKKEGKISNCILILAKGTLVFGTFISSLPVLLLSQLFDKSWQGSQVQWESQNIPQMRFNSNKLIYIVLNFKQMEIRCTRGVEDPAKPSCADVGLLTFYIFANKEANKMCRGLGAGYNKNLSAVSAHINYL